jgi:hypothetical protein
VGSHATSGFEYGFRERSKKGKKKIGSAVLTIVGTACGMDGSKRQALYMVVV